MELELSKDGFIRQLVKVGWTKREAEQEWECIQEDDDESGYDGP